VYSGPDELWAFQKNKLMKTITFFFAGSILVLSIKIWGLGQDTRLLNTQIIKARHEIHAIGEKEKSLVGYKDEVPVPLGEFYLDVFNTLKDIAGYYNEACEVKILGGKDFTDTREFFKASVYEGIRYVDILCRFNLREETATSLLYMFYGLERTAPLEILEVNVGKNKVILTMRLYGT
jgi:hypothetical protein